MLIAFRRSAPRYLLLVWIVGLFVVINTVMRLGLLVFEANIFNLLPWRLFPIIGAGLIHDLAAASYLLVPFLVTALVLPDTAWGRKSHGVVAVERRVTADGPPRHMHVVLVTMESLGVDFLQSFGGKKGLTPNLDKLAEAGLKSGSGRGGEIF